MPNYKEVNCSTACNRVKGPFPYNWDMNIYRGCEHGCVYCFAMYSHEFLGSEQYFDDIFIKINIVERLEKLLSSPSWKREVINIGGVTDSYQPIEEKYRLMPDILRLFIKHKNPCIISTKSDLILRDYELIAELASITYVNVAATITCMDETIRKKIEPGSVSSERRFGMLKEFSKTDACIGLHAMPLIPYLTDTRENLEVLFSRGKSCGAKCAIPDALNLRGRTKQAFFDFLHREYPELCKPFAELYKSGKLDRAYRYKLYSKVNELRTKYGLSLDYRSLMNEKLKQAEGVQLSLFD
ncbi:MAG: radical SAM protein [Oscillospiraceae bacterium]